MAHHLAEDELLALYAGAPDAPEGAADHLRSCGACATRRAAIEAWAHATLSAPADVFTAEQLAAQRDRVLARLELEGVLTADDRASAQAADLAPQPASAKVLAFPPAAGRSGTIRGMRGWLASAAAAGLIVGFSGGLLLSTLRSAPPAGLGAGAWPTVAALRPLHVRTAAAGVADAHLTDEVLLQEVDTALAGFRVAELRAIDALTPRLHAR